jgi:hypothetical protein
MFSSAFLIPGMAWMSGRIRNLMRGSSFSIKHDLKGYLLFYSATHHATMVIGKFVKRRSP